MNSVLIYFFYILVGNRVAWQAVGDASKEESMSRFIEFLDRLCPLFRPFVQAHKADLEARELQR